MWDRYEPEVTTVSIDTYNEVIKEREELRNKEDKLDELVSALDKVFKTKTDEERLKEVEELYEFCKENKYI